MTVGACFLTALVACNLMSRVLRGRTAFLRFLGTETDAVEAAEPGRPRFWFALGLAGILAALAILEVNQPYYFTQDDNFCQGLPIWLQSGRSLLDGVLPQWNPYQLAGEPTANVSGVTLTYPPVYLAYFVARFILRNEYCAIEVYLWMHLLAGFCATYWAARKWRVAPPLATAAAWTYTLSGFVLIGGRSWANIMGVIALMPLLFGALAVLKDGRPTPGESEPTSSSDPVKWRWIAGVAIVVGLSFHAGFVQLWVYALGFLILAAALLAATGSLPFHRFLWLIPALLLGIAIAAPLLYVQMEFASGVARADSGRGLRPDGILAMFVPYPLVRAEHPQRYGLGPGGESIGEFHFSGAVFVVACVALTAALTGFRFSKRVFAANVLVLCAALAFVCALGDKGYLWYLMRQAPWLAKFRNAERFLAVFNLFTAIGGAAALTRLFSGCGRRKRWEAGAALLVLALMLWHAQVSRASFWPFEDRPYPALPDEMKRIAQYPDPLKPHRIASPVPMERIPLRHRAPTYALSMDQNFPTVYSLLSLNGYDPLVCDHDFFQRYLAPAFGRHESAWSNLNEALEVESLNRLDRYKAYGVRWQVLWGPAVRLYAGIYPELLAYTRPPIAHLWEFKDVSPLAFPEHRPKDAFPIRFSGRGATVDVTGCPEGGAFIINVLAWPQFKVYADGHPIPFQPDQWGRIRADLPADVTKLEAVYSPPWMRGLVLGLILASAAIAMTWFPRRLSWRWRRASTSLIHRE